MNKNWPWTLSAIEIQKKMERLHFNCHQSVQWIPLEMFGMAEGIGSRKAQLCQHSVLVTVTVKICEGSRISPSCNPETLPQFHVFSEG